MTPIRFKVSGLFGRRSGLAIDLKDPVRIVYGINGSGKTTALRLLYSILSGRLPEVRDGNFRSLEVWLDSGQKLIAERLARSAGVSARGRALFPGSQCALRLILLGRSGQEECSFLFENDEEFTGGIPVDMIDREISWLERVGPSEWIDVTSDEVMNLSDVVERFSDRFPVRERSEELSWYRALIRELPVKFIQTQRLMMFKAEPGPRRSKRGRAYQNTVVEYARLLKKLIKDELTESARLAQTLDSSFLMRLLEGGNRKMSHLKLEHLLSEVEGLRDKLRAVDLLTKGNNVDVDFELIDERNLRAISLYLSDSIKKYQEIEPLANKLHLFLNIVNAKFEPRKSIRISEEFGIRISVGRNRDINPSLLSSGEQHELVLLFDLIFFSRPGTLVLIDEPEISLHIDWQKKFLSDIEAIGGAADLKFLLATHSPAIIGRRVDISQEI